MHRKKIHIVTDGSKEIGFGHIARCISFYDKFSELGYKVELLIDGEGISRNLLENRKYRLIEWHREITLLDFCKESVLFLDSLIATQKQTDYMQQLAYCFIVIDDFRRRSYKRAFIIDWTPNVEHTGKHSHNRHNNNCLLLGLEYSVLRQPFTEPSFYSIREMSALTVIMGGTDVHGLTYPLVKQISISFPEIRIYAVLGPGTPDLPECPKGVKVYRELDAGQLKEVFLQSDLVVSAGGQTLFELAALRVPTIAINVADNQEEDLTGLMTLGFLDKIFCWNASSLSEEIMEKIRFLRSADSRKKYLSDFRFPGIGKGLDKIMERIQHYCHESI